MKNLFVTFYLEDDNLVMLKNGFSYVKHIIEGDDLFIHENNKDSIRKLEKCKDYEVVYCSICYPSEFNIIKDFLDSNGVIGGPFVKRFKKQIENQFTCEAVEIPFERYLGLDISNEFTDYGTDFFESNVGKNVCYSASLEDGCYGGKCKFCDYSKYSKKLGFRRENVGKILSSLRYNIFGSLYLYLSGDTLYPGQVKEVIENKDKLKERNIGNARMSIRGDRHFNPILEEADDLSGLFFIIGMESFSQTLANKYFNKNVDFNNILHQTEIILSKGGRCSLNIMDDSVLMNKYYLEEAIDFIEKLKNVISRSYKDHGSYSTFETYESGKDKFYIHNSGKTKGPYQYEFLKENAEKIIRLKDPVEGLIKDAGYLAYPNRETMKLNSKLNHELYKNFKKFLLNVKLRYI